MSKKAFFIIFSLLLLCTSVIGQDTKISELKSSVEIMADDTIKVNTLLELSKSLYETSQQEAIAYSLQARELARRLEFKYGEATALKYQGLANFYLGEYVESYRAWEEALNIFENIGDKEGEANILSNIGVIYNNQGDDSRALELYLKALDLANETNDTLREISVLNNIGLIYSKKPSTEQLALENYQTALELSELFNFPRGIGSTSLNIGEIFFNNGDYSSALEYFERSMSAFKQTNSLDITSTYIYIGKIYAAREDYDMAVQYQEESLEIATNAGAKREVLLSVLALAQTYYAKGDMNNAIELNIRARKLADELGARYEKMSALRALAVAYESGNDFRNAFLAQVQAWNLKDTIFSEASQEQINKLRVQNEIDNYQQENELLKRDIELREVRNKQQQIVILVFIIGFIVTMVFIILLFRTNKLRRRANHILEKQNILITGQKKEITDSIRYASRIQNAVLTPVEDLSQFLPEHFILYRPRDIVSGDFYWITKINNRIMCVIADCTGHGVPGAFMSMLGVTFLNEIISRNPDIQANDMLNELRSHVITSLHQTAGQGGTQDGMDLATIIIDQPNSELQYAGANNPLILIRNNELKEYKPDKMPIGIHENANKPFTNHKIKYSAGDVLYTFSDGFPDQFGGPSGKKFMIRNFKEQLSRIHKKPMGQQLIMLEKVLDDWMEGVSQIDDILVMGIRL
ncbi:MAG: tetratricopeptide repeat protein [Bacteroidales bacterium]